MQSAGSRSNCAYSSTPAFVEAISPVKECSSQHVMSGGISAVPSAPLDDGSPKDQSLNGGSLGAGLDSIKRIFNTLKSINRSQNVNRTEPCRIEGKWNFEK